MGVKSNQKTWTLDNMGNQDFLVIKVKRKKMFALTITKYQAEYLKEELNNETKE